MNSFWLYFDMDRVLVDFASQAYKKNIVKKNNRVNWFKTFFLGSKFWKDMNFFPGAEAAFIELNDFCHKNGVNVGILSSARLISSRKGKYEWCKDKLPKYNFKVNKNSVILVRNAEDKCKFANKNTFLVDDNAQNISSFVEHKGNGYIFSQWNQSSIDEIKRLILNLLISNNY